jgi:hypothetical protein
LDNDWNRRYTETALVEELALLERHYRDGSFRECSCVPEKHLPLIAGLSSEMVMFVKDKDPKIEAFYSNLAEVAREARTSIEDGKFTYLPHNPPPRQYLPHGLTQHERRSPEVRRKLSACIKAAERKYCKGSGGDYSKCTYNPVAVCRSSIE